MLNAREKSQTIRHLFGLLLLVLITLTVQTLIRQGADRVSKDPAAQPSAQADVAQKDKGSTSPPGPETDTVPSPSDAKEQSGDTGEPPPVSHADLTNWPGAKVLEVVGGDRNAEGVRTVVTIIQPTDLPYPVRIEEKRRLAENLQEETVVASREMVANRLLVKFRGDAPGDALRDAIARQGGTLGRELGSLGIRIIHIDPYEPDSVIALAEFLNRQEAAVEYAEPDFIARINQTFPNDPQFPQQWGKHNTGQAINFSSGTADADFDAPEAWSLRRDAANIVVAVIDTGVLYTHEDLDDNLWINPGETPGNGFDDDGNGYVDDIHGINAILNNGNPLDDNGHGTHCAGIIGAEGNNATGIAGVAWNVQIMGVKFLSASGSGATADMIECVDYARREGADIINASFGGGSPSNAARDAIQRAGSDGVIFVAAAGNESSNNDFFGSYPANYPLANIISVASSTFQDRLSSFSNFGETTVDVVAPGSDILSTYIGSSSAYRRLSGTSMATPQVAGALALLKAQFPNEGLALIDRILATADPVDAFQGRVASGARLNLDNALRGNDPGTFPRISTPLEDQSAEAGDTVSFSIVASGSGLSYAWTRNGASLPGETSAMLTVSGVTAADAGLYEVTVSNASGSTRSSATLSVVGPSPDVADAMDDPDGVWFNRSAAAWTRQNSITYDGVDAARSPSLGNNQEAAIERTVNGPGTLSFWWRVSSEGNYDFLRFELNGVEQQRISGEVDWNRVSLEIPEGEQTATWRYTKDFSVSSGQDSGFLDAFAVTVEQAEPPRITTQPAGRIAAPGDDVILTVAATGSAPLAYQWFRNGESIPGQTTDQLAFTGITSESEGLYQVSVSNSAGTALSDVVSLEVSANRPPRILQQPRDRTVSTGDEGVFSVRAEGTAPLVYQWYRDGEVLVGETGASLILPSVDIADQGAYTVVVGNSLDSVESTPALLRVVDTVVGPEITKEPDSQTLVSGDNAVLRVEASGGGLSFQWFKDGNPIPGATTAVLPLFNLNSNTDAGLYYVEISNGIGTAVSRTVRISVLTGPNELGDAADSPYLNWRTSGDGTWFSQTVETFDGVDALQSGEIGDNGTSEITIDLTGPGELSFAWKVSSEADYDFLRVTVNDALQAEISGLTDWEVLTLELPDGPAQIRWAYQKDGTVSLNDDAAWIDEVLFNATSPTAPRITASPQKTFTTEGEPFQLSLTFQSSSPATIQWRKNGVNIPGANTASYRVESAALDDSGTYSAVVANSSGSAISRNAPVAVFSAGNPFSQALDFNAVAPPPDAFDTGGEGWLEFGDARWFPQNFTTHDGIDAMETPLISDDQFTAFSTFGEGPGILVFWWKASSEAEYDELDFFIGEEYLVSLSGETDWEQQVIEVTDSGWQEFYWQFVKDGSISSGQDTGWIDQVRFFPASGGPAILEQPRSRLVEPGESVTLNVDVRSLGTPAFQWYRGTSGDARNPVDGATGSSFTAPPGDTDSRYWVRVTDEFGNADSGTAELLLVGGGIPSRFPRAYTVGEGWFYTAWFGLFQADEFPWIFHESHGWLFVGNETGTARWFYDRALGWLYTAEDLYPFLYSLNYGDWIYYQRDSREPRFFFVYSLDAWIEVE